MSDPELILHIGAPKCGSSALQTALTLAPDHDSTVLGKRLRYSGCQYEFDGQLQPVFGEAVTRLGQASAYGYTTWPNFGPEADNDGLVAALSAVLHTGRDERMVPVLSSEGWIGRPEPFAEILAGMGYPAVDVVVYLRPVIDWINSAWWQWGVWSGRTFVFWLERQAMPYDFADKLALWAQIPGVRLIVRHARPDTVAKFAAEYGITLPALPTLNASSPPSLIGFLLRNRRFRSSPHDGAVEFVYQRWCPPVPERRLWALRAVHVHALRPQKAKVNAALTALLEPAAQADLFDDPRWREERAYHDDIRQGSSMLRQPEDLPGLYAALATGLQAAEAEAECAAPLPAPPEAGAEAELADWDAVLGDMLFRLIEADEAVRDRVLRLPGPEMAAWLRRRLQAA